MTNRSLASRASSLVLLLCATLWAWNAGVFAEEGDEGEQVIIQGGTCKLTEAQCVDCPIPNKCEPPSWCGNPYYNGGCVNWCKNSKCCDDGYCKSGGFAVSCSCKYVESKLCASLWQCTPSCNCSCGKDEM